MVYSNKFVMTVYANGVQLKELHNGMVKIPFNTEYTLRFRNRNNRRAVVKFFIDGEEVSGPGYIIKANDYTEIKRHYEKDRAFKFVSLESEEAADFGKNGPNLDKVKGVIEARFYLEKENSNPVEIHHHHHHTYPWRTKPYHEPMWMSYNSSSDNVYGARRNKMERRVTNLNSLESKYSATSKPESTYNLSGFESSATITTDGIGTLTVGSLTSPILKDGCTVEGTMTGQNFTSQAIEIEDNYVTVKCFLQGCDNWTTEPSLIVSKSSESNLPETNKTNKVLDLESENEKLRLKIAQLENEKLKAQLEKLKS